MGSKTILIKKQVVQYDDLVAFIRSQNKIKGIHFIKTNMKLDLRIAKEAVEAIRSGQVDIAFELLDEHANCGNPILEKDYQSNLNTSKTKNPFLIEENKTTSSAKVILFIALLVLLLGIGLAYFTVSKG